MQQTLYGLNLLCCCYQTGCLAFLLQAHAPAKNVSAEKATYSALGKGGNAGCCSVFTLLHSSPPWAGLTGSDCRSVQMIEIQSQDLVASSDAGRKVAKGIHEHCILPFSALKQISPIPPHCPTYFHFHSVRVKWRQRSAGDHALYSYFNTKDFFAHLSTDCP